MLLLHKDRPRNPQLHDMLRRHLNLCDCDQEEQDSEIKIWLLGWRGWSHLWNQPPLYKPHLRLYNTGLELDTITHAQSRCQEPGLKV